MSDLEYPANRGTNDEPDIYRRRVDECQDQLDQTSQSKKSSLHLVNNCTLCAISLHVWEAGEQQAMGLWRWQSGLGHTEEARASASMYCIDNNDKPLSSQLATESYACQTLCDPATAAVDIFPSRLLNAGPPQLLFYLVRSEVIQRQCYLGSRHVPLGRMFAGGLRFNGCSNPVGSVGCWDSSGRGVKRCTSIGFE